MNDTANNPTVPTICPWLKVTSYHRHGQGLLLEHASKSTADTVIESFANCVGETCQAWRYERCSRTL